MICLVGANGTGKSHILELISAAAHRVGLSSGIDLPRGDPFVDDVRDFSVEFYLAADVSTALDQLVVRDQRFSQWDRTITVRGASGTMEVGGNLDAPTANELARQVVATLQQSQEVHHLRLAADRSFPKRDLPQNGLAQVFDNPWIDIAWTRKRAHHTTRTLYEEWLKYCSAKENSAANQFYQGARRAAEDNSEPPSFLDTFASYRNSLRQVMPHLPVRTR